MRGTKIAIVGRGRAGKDEAAEFLRDRFGLRYPGSTSAYLAPLVAEKLGITAEEAYERRYEDRQLWYETAIEKRKDDPAYFARCAARDGDLVVGLRDYTEMAITRETLVDLVVWVERETPPDPTLKFGPGLADIVIHNDAFLWDFHARLYRLGRSLGLGR